MTPSELLYARFGSATPDSRGVEWRRLGLFVACGTAIFILAVVGAAFVPFGWPDGLRRSAHPTIFVPIAIALTVRLLRKDAGEITAARLFNPWPVARLTYRWLLLGSALVVLVAVTFVLAFGLRWAPNAKWSAANTLLAIWAIVLTAAAEEIAFRGYALWRFTRLLGFWPAQAIVGMLFMVSHLTLGGYAFLPALIGTITGSVLYGMTFAHTGGVAAPIALHSGWNIAQHLLLSPLERSATPFAPSFPHPPTAPEYAAMLVIVGVAMVATTIGILKSKQDRPG